MSLLPALIGVAAIILGALGLREITREGGGGSGDGPTAAARPAGQIADGRGIRSGRSGGGDSGEFPKLGDRIRRAGLEAVLAPRSVLLAKGCCAAVGMLFGSLFTGVLPGRLAPVILIAVAAGGFILPDFMLERTASRRHRGMVAALPDVLDLLAVSVQTGRGLGGCLLDLASSGRGPLIAEMSRAGDDMAWGSGQAAALEGLRQRVGGPEITSFVSTLERSRRLGSPLADQLRRQSATLRQDQRRTIEEQAARAAPKIQLVIALILVPSVLLLIVAALAANADSLINVGY
ncbi:MAG TPA: type II secretion system F family protein [Solirubrobacterales bacterium]|jgi:tight adherence protein C|nr:type II secretion system F family protein [Solirubrobacterales bacterium]HMU26668.1 type II secretion system F family protein [Solirubrobacterales bacterium]HMX72269.1 type II secretion system F family protein [Solirubrobacterales bacterium]HNA24279.1 type II secretion system F family protein [Solirubrobacterales bacterium]HNA44020.1 type II secretion system F family protein [Solirubrobacterales bacterium]